MTFLSSLCLLFHFATFAAGQQLTGDVAAVYALLDRVLPGSKQHFDVRISHSCSSQSDTKKPFYQIEDTSDGRIKIQGTSASELSSGLGLYFRNYCNMTIGWPRGGSSNVFIPKSWPRVGAPVIKERVQPWSYFMNVCTHSYSLVWYDWQQWESFIDWMALSGINLVLATTGQEEVQYKVFRKFGLNDTQIREWFNGPALLAWSRGQNEYGSNIAGPLPRSWMKKQWSLQRQILGRYRSLGIVGQLPGFQGNVPLPLKDILKDSNMTDNGRGTAWIDSLDPVFAKIADEYMKTMLEDFGTDHWYQLDGYFNGATAPWLASSTASPAEAQDDSSVPADSVVVADPMWYKRGVAAYTSLNRTDPEAIWSFQAFSFFTWSTAQQERQAKGFVDAVPDGKMVFIDMDLAGDGEWKKWKRFSYFGARFIWTTIHDFGGVDGMKGNLSHINEIPFAAMDKDHPTSIWGTGFTPEGIDQNPAVYEFLLDANWRSAPVSDIARHIITRSHRRYALTRYDENIAEAWSLLVESTYSMDYNIQDCSGVKSFPGTISLFKPDRVTPLPRLCKTFRAWQLMVEAASSRGDINLALTTFRYDLINLGRELLAQLTVPVSQNFWQEINKRNMYSSKVSSTGEVYIKLLEDMDDLVGTEYGFLLGPWIQAARRWGSESNDCSGNIVGIVNCKDFYEWNARVQITTWNPTPKGAAQIPHGPVDYAGKHWSGLIKDYYAQRARLIMGQALSDAAAKKSLDKAAVERLKAELAYNWTTATKEYPTSVQGDALSVSQAMLRKYAPFFSSCSADVASSDIQEFIV